MVHRGSLFRIEQIHGAHQNFERIACKRFFSLARQSQTDASPVRLRSLSDQVPTCLKCLDRLRSGGIARGHRGYGLPISELISEGNVGLMQAIKRFEPDKGFRLATYATWWIKAAIQEYILRSWSLVKMGTTVNQKKLFFNLRKAKNKITVLDEGDMRPDEVKIIARQLGVTQTDVIHMNRRHGGGDASLNAPIREDGNSSEWEDRLVDEHADQETTLAASEEFENRRKALASALSALNDRERRIFEARRLAEEPITLSELADEFGVSRERVRQISVCAFEKVQRAVRHRVAVMETPAPLLVQ